MKRLVGGLTAALLLASAAPAWAHATFSSPASGSVSAGTTGALTVQVPNEREDTDYNTRVDVLVPDGWSAVSCQAQATWTCDAKATVSGRPAVTWTKSGTTQAQDETFRFTAKAAPAAGKYAFKTLQTYQNGEVVRWIGTSSSDAPAPVLSVTGSAATASPTPAKTATSVPIAAATTAAPVASATAVTGTASSSPTAATTAPSTAAASATASPSASASPSATQTPAAQETPTLLADPPSSEDGGSRPVLFVVLLIIGLGAAATAVVLARRRRDVPLA